MKRFIDTRRQAIEYRFAWFDTGIDEFEKHSDSMAWDWWDEFEKDYKGNQINRYKSLCPKWVFRKSVRGVQCQRIRLKKT